jgi:hypothetical protein
MRRLRAAGSHAVQSGMSGALPYLQPLLQGGVVFEAQLLPVLGVGRPVRLHRRQDGTQPGVVAAVRQLTQHRPGTLLLLLLLLHARAWLLRGARRAYGGPRRLCVAAGGGGAAAACIRLRSHVADV